MAYDYIHKRYGLRIKRGMRVEHTVCRVKGTIRNEGRSHKHYVRVLLDGRKHPSFCHPLELVFLDEKADAP